MSVRGCTVGCGYEPVFARRSASEMRRQEDKDMAARPCPRCGGRMLAEICNRTAFGATHVVRCVEPTPSEDVQSFLNEGGFGGEKGLRTFGA